MKIKDNNRGFSMVELIVTIAIIAIMVGVISVSVLGQLEKARMTKALTEAKTMYDVAQISVISASIDEDEAFLP